MSLSVFTPQGIHIFERVEFFGIPIRRIVAGRGVTGFIADLSREMANSIYNWQDFGDRPPFSRRSRSHFFASDGPPLLSQSLYLSETIGPKPIRRVSAALLTRSIAKTPIDRCSGIGTAHRAAGRSGEVILAVLDNGPPEKGFARGI